MLGRSQFVSKMQQPMLLSNTAAYCIFKYKLDTNHLPSSLVRLTEPCCRVKSEIVEEWILKRAIRLNHQTCLEKYGFARRLCIIAAKFAINHHNWTMAEYIASQQTMFSHKFCWLLWICASEGSLYGLRRYHEIMTKEEGMFCFTHNQDILEKLIISGKNIQCVQYWLPYLYDFGNASNGNLLECQDDGIFDAVITHVGQHKELQQKLAFHIHNCVFYNRNNLNNLMKKRLRTIAKSRVLPIQSRHAWEPLWLIDSSLFAYLHKMEFFSASLHIPDDLYCFIINGSLSKVISLVEKTPFNPTMAILCAVKGGNIHLLKYLIDECKIRLDSENISQAQKHHVNAICESNTSIRTAVYKYAGLNFSDLTAIKMCSSVDSKLRESRLPNILTYMAAHNKVEAFFYFWDMRVDQPDDETIYAAISRDNLELLQFLHINGQWWSYGAAIIAIKFGSLNCLKYLFEKNCPIMCAGLTRIACEYHQFQCLSYLVDRGYPIPDNPMLFPSVLPKEEELALKYFSSSN